MQLPEALATGEGVLPDQWLSWAIDDGVIDAEPFTIPKASVQPASLDLRLGEVAYRIRCSFLPGPASRSSERLKDLVIDELDLHGDGVVLETNRPYLIPLKERLALPAGHPGQGQPEELDRPGRRVHPGHHRRLGPLRRDRRRLRRAGSTSRSCRCRSRSGCGRTSRSTSCGCRSAGPSSPTTSCASATARQPAAVPRRRAGRRRRSSTCRRACSSASTCAATPPGRVGYRARDHAPLLDMTQVGAVEPEPYWEPVTREDGDRIVLTPGQFYLLMSDEAVTIPPDAGRRDDGLRPDQRRAAHPLRRLLRPRLRLRPRRRLPRVHAPRSRCGPTTCRS